GRVRVSLDPPSLVNPTPAALASVHGRVTVRFTALSRSRISTWSLAVDGVPAVSRRQVYPRGITLDTTRLVDGWHALRADARDWPGNDGALDWSIRVDNTPPTIIVRRVVVRFARGPARLRATRPRTVRLVVAAGDPGSTGRLPTTLTVTRRGAPVSQRTLLLRPGPTRSLAVGRLRRGRYVVRVDLHDRAGNAATILRRILVR
ncbi:unnamed protein product, partial [Phaeothamnion confervicola]